MSLPDFYMSSLSEEKVQAYLNSRGPQFTNAKGMLFGLTADKGVWTLCKLPEHPLEIEAYTEPESLFAFITWYQLQSVEEIDLLDYSRSWRRYLNGGAQIDISPKEVKATLCFKIHLFKSLVFSLDLHFYDEVYEHLTLPGDFQRYVSSNEYRLHAAEQNRYKVSRR